MKTIANWLIPPEVAADNRAIIDHILGVKPLDPEVARRVHECAEQATEKLRRQYGTLNIAVDLIRETRDEE